jgi:hypothetical protein
MRWLERAGPFVDVKHLARSPAITKFGPGPDNHHASEWHMSATFPIKPTRRAVVAPYTFP